MEYCVIPNIVNHDTPYLVTDPLPSIFSSTLFWETKTNFLSNSVPNLHQISWVTVTDDNVICEKAEQAISDLYDNKISTFYEEARLEVSITRMKPSS